jgi:two-component system CheB/CheR fusion protein
MAAPKRPSRQRAKKAAPSVRTSAPAAMPAPHPRQAGFPVVGIGASAGGLEAMEVFFAQVPADSGIAFIIVSHIDPHAVSFLPELLRRNTAVTVREAVDGRRLTPNEVVVTPPGKALTVAHGVVSLHDIAVPHGVPLPIDILFRSLAEDQQERAIGIVLSGTGTDGTLGLQAIKSVSGMAMAQAPSSAKFAGMPQSAIDTGLVDYILPPEQMPEALLAYTRGPYLIETAPSPSTQRLSPEVLQEALSLIHARTGHSFAAYKVSTIRRRLERRLNLHQIEQPEHYLRYLREHPEEVDYLFHDLLIGVTSFFRDPEAFDALAQILRRVLESKRNGELVRVWVPGCSTGEEAYSLAMLLRELLEEMNKPCPVQVFATDLDDRAIETARLGRYPEGIAIDVSAPRLQRFFTHDEGFYQIAKEIREIVVFATHNVLADPPFSQLDLLACRNLLIYLDSPAQQQLIAIFHYALRPGGVLFLGSSETIGHLDALFSTEDRQWKLFVRNSDAVPTYPLPDSLTGSFYMGSDRGPHLEGELARHPTPSSRAEAYLAHRYAPPSVLVTARGDIVHFHGRTGMYLEPPRGTPNLNIYNMVREGLDRVLAPVIRAALVHDGPVVRTGIHVATNGSATIIDLVVERITEAPPLRGLLLVSFRPTADPPTAPPAELPGRVRQGRRRRADVERELQETRESLQSTIEELEAANEELTSANEELQSTNEETQSANEELKTSKEEMQSLNEELQTVNAELRSKIDELSHANDDMTNLLNSTEVATIFLDQQLLIKRYTPSATRVMALIPSDVGRPVRDLTSSLDYAELVADAAAVLRTLVAQSKEVRTRSGAWYLVRLIPYRTSENVIDGVVLTFVDIDQVKRAEDAREHVMAQLRTETEERQRAEVRLRHLSRVFQDATVPIILEDDHGLITDFNTEAEQVYGWSREDVIGQPIMRLTPADAHAELAELWRRCRQGEDLRNIEMRHQTRSGEILQVRITVSPLTNEQGDIMGMATIVKRLDEGLDSSHDRV